MNKLNIKVIVLAVGFVFSAGSMAESMSKDDYKAGKDKIAAEYKSARAGCDSLSGNPKDICEAEAKGSEKIAKAELEASYKPTPKNRYQARIAKAEADYGVAKERCDDADGNAEDICKKEAKSVKTAAKADAKVQMKTTDANDVAKEKSAEARKEAKDKNADARKDAAAEKLDAQYAVAKEKCDTFAGNAKDSCLDQAKARFGK